MLACDRHALKISRAREYRHRRRHHGARGVRGRHPDAGRRPAPKSGKRCLPVACTKLLTHYFADDRSLATFRAFVLPDLTRNGTSAQAKTQQKISGPLRSGEPHPAPVGDPWLPLHSRMTRRRRAHRLRDAVPGHPWDATNPQPDLNVRPRFINSPQGEPRPRTPRCTLTKRARACEGCQSSGQRVAARSVHPSHPAQCPRSPPTARMHSRPSRRGETTGRCAASDADSRVLHLRGVIVLVAIVR